MRMCFSAGGEQYRTLRRESDGMEELKMQWCIRITDGHEHTAGEVKPSKAVGMPKGCAKPSGWIGGHRVLEKMASRRRETLGSLPER